MTHSPFTPQDSTRPVREELSWKLFLRETKKAFLLSWRSFLPVLFLLALLHGGVSLAVAPPQIERPQSVTEATCAESANPTACLEENAAQIEQERKDGLVALINNIQVLLLSVLLSFLVLSVVEYAGTIFYLRKVMKDPPALSVAGYMRFITVVSYKYIRPILWNLIPILGQIMYTRSLIRYTVANPLSVLGRKPELATSWDLTCGNVWRILGSGVVVGVVLVVVLVVVFFLFILPASFVTAFLLGEGGALFIIALLTAFGQCLGSWISALFSVGVLRVLLNEKNGAPIC